MLSSRDRLQSALIVYWGVIQAETLKSCLHVLQAILVAFLFCLACSLRGGTSDGLWAYANGCSWMWPLQLGCHIVPCHVRL